MVSVSSVIVYRWHSYTFLGSSISSCITNLLSDLMYRSAIACCHLDKSEAVESKENDQKRMHIDKNKIFRGQSNPNP